MTEPTKTDHDLAKVSDVVILIHGIRDYGKWVQTADTVLSSDHIVVTMPKYGRYSVGDFLKPWKSKRRPMERIHREFMDVDTQYPNAKISVIAHSFGTYLFTRVLQRYRNIRVWRVVLCGSVLPQSFDWAKIAGQIGSADNIQQKRDFIVNDCGDADGWPALAYSASWSYGSAGTDGFGNIHVQDRYHSGEHGLFFEEKFMERYWRPFIQKGEVVAGQAKQAEKLGWGISALRLLPLRWLALCIYLLVYLVLPILAVALLLWFLQPPTNPITYQAFVAELNEARRQGPTGMDTFWREYRGDKVEWKGIVVDVKPAENAYRLAPCHDAPESDEVIAKFDDPDKFRAFLRVGQEIKIRGVIVAGNWGALLMDCHFVPQEE